MGSTRTKCRLSTFEGDICSYVEKGRREGAITELEKELTNLNIELKKYERQIRLADLSIKQYAKGLRDKTLGLIVDYEKRLKELQGVKE